MALTSVGTTRRSRRIHVDDHRSTWQKLDYPLLAAVAGLLLIGTLLVWSATAAQDDLSGDDPTAYLFKNLVNIVIGLALAFGVAATDFRWVRIWTPMVYAGSIIGLCLVLSPLGSVINGARAWINLGGLSIQPAEFAKLGVICGMALLLAEKIEAKRRDPALRDSDVIGALAIAAIPAGLIALQPDLGTLLVLCAAVFGVLGVAGAPKRWLIGLVSGAVLAAVAAVQLGVLQGYQLDRFVAYINPAADPDGAGYNTIQARIAIGNGGLLGQGLFDGSQTQSGFVPEQHTDFVFTVAGEELGLVGAGVIIALFVVVLWRAARIATRADDMFSRIAAAGIVCWFGFQSFQNIGMCLGIMPVTGVPLPFVSYGGTSMFASLMAVGLLINIHMRSERRAGLGGVLSGRSLRSRRY